MRNYISPIISQRKPEFLKTNYEKFSQFIDHFYLFLEEQGNPLEVLENFYERCDSNNNEEEYVDKILSDCGFFIQKPLSISKKELILHLRDFYLSRGSEASFKFLYRILYDSDIRIDYPRKQMLIPSQANYSGKLFVFTTAFSKDTLKFQSILTQANSYDLFLKGVSSGVECAVESLSLIYGVNQTYLKIQIDAAYRQFQKGEGIEIISQTTNEKIIENFIDNVGIEIVNPGKNYNVGDNLFISHTKIAGSAKVKSLKTGSINIVQISSKGTGYAIGDPVFSEKRLRGHSFSAVVSKIDCSNNYLSIPYGIHLNIHSGNFTIETWSNIPHSISDLVICSNKHKTLNRGWDLKINGQKKVVFQLYGASVFKVTSASQLVINKWNHIAVSRNGNTLKIFINGIETASQVIGTGLSSTEALRIGLDTNGNNPFLGYMDELRLTKGVARYTSNFTVPNEPFSNSDPSFASVSLLLHFNQRNDPPVFLDESNYANSVTTTGSIFISELRSKFSGASCLFSGLGGIDGLTIYNPGYDFDHIPNLVIQSELGINAVLSPQSDYIGQIESIEILDPFIDSESNSTVSIQSTTGTGAVFSPVIQSVFQEQHSWKSFEGVLGSHSTLLDSFYYQQFSYNTYSTIPRKESDAIVDEWLHPAGFVRFSILDIFYSSYLKSPNGGFDSVFYLTLIKIIEDSVNVLLFNPVYIDDPIIKNMDTNTHNLLLNPVSWINWFKDSDNFFHPIGLWDDYMADTPTGITDEEILARKNINNDSIPMAEALDAEIEILI